MNTVRIRCKGADALPLSALKPLQGELKALSPVNLAKMKASILEHGFCFPFFVWRDKGSNYILDGHQRDRTLRAMAGDAAYRLPAKFPVVYVDARDRGEAAKILLKASSQYGTITREGLEGFATEFGLSLPEVSLQIHFDAIDIQDFGGGEPGGGGGLTDPDAIPEPPKTPVARPGDVWVLGQHRVICGDSTKEDDVRRLMAAGGGARAAMIFTDPPWNVAIGQDNNPKHKQRAGLKNDNLGAQFGEFLRGWSAACLPFLAGDLYCVMGCGEWPTIDQALRGQGMHWSASIAWVKDVFVLGRSNYHRRFEPIWYGWPASTKSSYHGGRAQDDVWEIPRPKVSKEHPTMKPVELMERAITNSSKPEDIVLDPFLGSGSTLLACEKAGRRCYGIEIEPAYVDVIVKRWEDFTGQKAEKA